MPCTLPQEHTSQATTRSSSLPSLLSAMRTIAAQHDALQSRSSSQHSSQHSADAWVDARDHAVHADLAQQARCVLRDYWHVLTQHAAHNAQAGGGCPKHMGSRVNYTGSLDMHPPVAARAWCVHAGLPLCMGTEGGMQCGAGAASPEVLQQHVGLLVCTGAAVYWAEGN